MKFNRTRGMTQHRRVECGYLVHGATHDAGGRREKLWAVRVNRDRAFTVVRR